MNGPAPGTELSLLACGAGESEAAQRRGGLEIRAVEPADAAAIHRLLTTGLPGITADRDRWLRRWHWQYEGNPFRGCRPVGWVLTDGQRVAGHLGAVYLPLLVNGRQTTGVVGTDFVVAEEAAARGRPFAGLELARALFASSEGCTVLATTANEKTEAIFGRFGCRPVEWTREFWRAPVKLAQEIRSCRGATSRAARRLFSGIGGPAGLWIARRWYESLQRRPTLPIPLGHRLETTVPRLAPYLGALWEAAVAARMTADGRGFSIGRSQAYLDWRYGEHPERERLRVLAIRDPADAVVAAAVTSFEGYAGRQTLFVEELMAIPSRRDLVRALLCAALRLAGDLGAETLVTATGERSMRDVYWQLGFESRARSASALVIQSGSSSCGPASGPTERAPADDRVHLWHGEMF